MASFKSCVSQQYRLWSVYSCADADTDVISVPEEGGKSRSTLLLDIVLYSFELSRKWAWTEVSVTLQRSSVNETSRQLNKQCLLVAGTIITRSDGECWLRGDCVQAHCPGCDPRPSMPPAACLSSATGAELGAVTGGHITVYPWRQHRGVTRAQEAQAGCAH